MIPPRLAPIAFGLILSCMMSLVISGVSTWQAIGIGDDTLTIWVQSWLSSWPVAFPVVTVLAPMVRRLVARMTRPA